MKKEKNHKLYRKMGFYERYIKRAIDIFCSGLAIIVFCWLYAIIALLVRIKLGSPVLFTQYRPGLIDPKTGKERIFKMYKFRTMTDKKDAEGNLLPDEVRLTKFGAWLRSTSLDELPEAFCILNGTMTLIGPRPQLVRDICGLYSQVLSDKVMRWVNNCNPFLLAMSIAMFNIARNIHFKNRFINYISKLSLLIYIIHENIILRTYFRPAMWNYVYKRFGYSDVIQWVFIISFIIFIFGILCSILYVLTLQRFVNKVSGKLYEVVRIKYLLFEKFCLMIGEKKDNR